MERSKVIEGLKMSLVGSAAVAAGFVSFPLFAAGVATLGIYGSSVFIKTAGAAATTASTVTVGTAVLSNTGAAVAAGGSILTAIGAGKVTSVVANGVHKFGRDVAQNYEQYKQTELVQARKNNQELRERLNALSQELETIKANLED